MPRPYAWVFVRRSLATWALLHVAWYVLAALANTPRSDRWQFAVGGSLLGLLLIPGIVLLETEIRRDRGFLANLGVGRIQIVLLVVLTAILAESIFALVI